MTFLALALDRLAWWWLTARVAHEAQELARESVRQ